MFNSIEKDTFNSLHLALVDQHFSGVSFFRGEPGLVVGLSPPFQIQVTSISPIKSKITILLLLLRLMMDCKQLQVGDYCVATVPARDNLPSRLMSSMPSIPPMPSVRPPFASGSHISNQASKKMDVTLERSRSESSLARKRRAPFVEQASMSWPSGKFHPTSRQRWGPQDEEVQDPVDHQEPLQPTDLRISKSREEEEGVCSANM